MAEYARSFLSPTSTADLAYIPHDAPLIFGRWIDDYSATPELVATAFARVFDPMPSSREFARHCLTQQTLHWRQLSTGNDTILLELLIAMWRLLRSDLPAFRGSVDVKIIWSLRMHANKSIRLISIHILSLLLNMSDARLTKTIDLLVGSDSIRYDLEEGMSVDLQIFPVEDGLRVRGFINLCKNALEETKLRLPVAQGSNVIDISGILLPRFCSTPQSASQVVPTRTSCENQRLLAQAVSLSDCILVQGPSGSGKTFMIEDLARVIGRSRDLVRIHLGDQTDAKLLLGTYVTSDVPGRFTWQSGILANAVKEGKWLLIEDIDKAPNDVVSVLLPLLEKRQIHIPSRSETIVAPAGFKLLATKTTDRHAQWTAEKLIGGRLWNSIGMEMPPIEELRQIVASKFPLLSSLSTKLMAVYTALVDLASGKLHSRVKRDSSTRSIGTLDLMKWCRRIQAIYVANAILLPDDPISPSIEFDIFSEAVDCFASSLPTMDARTIAIGSIGQNLHMPPERVQMYLESHSVEASDAQAFLQIGRAALAKPNASSRARRRPFATTGHALRLLEQLMIAIRLCEPLLLVGETGTGKTTTIQYLADILGHNLVAINMSQQTESGDLLGGYKPVDTKLIAIPLIDTFKQLFERTLSHQKNRRFLDEIERSFNKSQWRRLVALLKEAIKIAQASLTRATKKQLAAQDMEMQAGLRKKRKLDDSLLEAWQEFSVSLDQFSDQQQHTSKAFTFAFVEGALVRAMRKGEWVLLDEINLAAPDTLESINGLLQDDRSIFLSETGNTEAITPHPNFRLFSCMNPATDVGKRELPRGVRSRFTELYVHPPDTNMQDLIAIIEKYIGGLCVEDTRAIADVADLYLKTKRLSQENRLVDGANQKPHYSIRTLTRTLTYVVDISMIYGLRRSLYEGFCMSYLTLLDKDSEILLKPVIEEYTIMRVKNARSFMSQIPKQPEHGSWVQFKHYWLPRGPLATVDDPQYILTPFVEKNMLNLVRAASTKKYPILLQGPTSSGKTSMVEYLAKKTGHSFVRINNHEHTDLQEYLGSYVSNLEGNLVFQEGILVQAVRSGQWLVLDELNLAPSDVLEALNRLLDDNRELLIPETQEVIKPHPSFILFATQNPAGLYGGRKHLSRAFRNRFLELHFEDIPENELETILCQRCQIAPSYCKKIVEVYKQLSIRRQSSRVFEQKHSFATLRDLFRWATRPAVGYDQLALNGYLLLAERVRRDEDKLVVREVIEKVMKVSLVSIEEYNIAELDEFKALVSMNLQDRVVWTRAMRRLFCLVALAFRNNEPILLVGETGCGKTAVCQLMAEALSRPIQMLNAHQNTETADLIGAQRPIRDRAFASATLVADLQSFLARAEPDVHHGSDLEQLRAEFRPAKLVALCAGRADLLEELKILQARVARSKALFEWSDGPLVQAMRGGEIFLLDEISLAEDAVLERLNSVLETSRSLVLAEKGIQDSTLKGSSEYQFCATMNPGGDFGKRELSPALRNRFTEVWVPAMSDDADVLQILEATLRLDLRPLARPMVAFAKYFCATFSTALTSSAVSIRDLLAWARFCNDTDLHVEESFTQGAALVYIDALGVTILDNHKDEISKLQIQRKQCLDELSRLCQRDCAKIYEMRYPLDVGNSFVRIGPFRVQSGTAERIVEPFEFEAPTTLSNATRVFRAMQIQKPILLEGSPGVGKTSLITAIARLARRQLVRINLSDQTDLIDLFGSDTPVEDSESIAFAWRDAPFLRAMQNGDWVLLDEMNLASQSILEGLNACLDHRAEAFIPELNKSFPCHKDFRIFAAQNPHSQGGDRKGLPKSFVNRFTVVFCDPLEANDLQVICSRQYPDLRGETIENVVSLVSAVQRQTLAGGSISSAGGPWEFNLRDVLRWLTITDRKKEESHAVYYANSLIRQRFRSSHDRSRCDDLLSHSFSPQDASYRPSFARLSTQHVLIGRTTTDRDLDYAPREGRFHPTRNTHREALESILLCVENAWPCLLIGLSGCGKTSLIESVACLQGRPLRSIAMNNDMDASDLLGSFEQRDDARATSELLGKVKEFSHKLLRRHIVEDTSAGLAILEALENVDANHESAQSLQLIQQFLLAHTPEASGLLAELEDLRAKRLDSSMGHFQWIDGSLLQAVRDGEWLVLENANLCKPSVLDRLNGLLEPGGTLIVNERIMADGSPMLIRPHKDFRIFMTVDPRYGELSRAMRNRSLEVYLMQDEDRGSFLADTRAEFALWSAIGASCEAAMDTEISPTRARYVAEALTRHIPQNFQERSLYGCDAQSRLTLQLLGNLTKRMDGFLRIAFASAPSASAMSSPTSLDSYRSVSLEAQNQFRIAEIAFAADELEASWDQLMASRRLLKSRQEMEILDLVLTIKSNVDASYSGFLSRFDKDNMHARQEIILRLIWLAKEPGTYSLEKLLQTVRVVKRLVKEDCTMYNLSNVLDESSYVRPLTSGLYMQVLWSTLRPSLPLNEASHRQFKTMEALLDRVDKHSRAQQHAVRNTIPLKQKYIQTLVWLSNQMPNSIEAVSPDVAAVANETIPSVAVQSSPLTEIFLHIYSTVKLHEVANFSHWKAIKNPILTDLLLLNSLAEANSLELFEFFESPVTSAASQHARLSRVTYRGLSLSKRKANNTLSATQSRAEFTKFIQEWRTLIKSSRGLTLGGVDGILLDLNEIGHQIAQHSVSILQPKNELLARILLLNLHSLIEILVQTKSDKTVEVFNINDVREFDSRAEYAATLNHLLNVLDKSDLESVACTLLRRVAQLLLECKEQSIPHDAQCNLLAAAWLNWAKAFFLLYIPNVPQDPGTDSILLAKFRQWRLDRATARAKIATSVHKTFTGGQESPIMDALEEEIYTLAAQQANTPAMTIYRPETSKLYQLHAEFEYCSGLMHTSGAVDKLMTILEHGGSSSNAERRTIVSSIERTEARLNAFLGYEDVVSPVLTAIAALKTGLELMSDGSSSSPSKTSSNMLADPLELLAYASHNSSGDLIQITAASSKRNMLYGLHQIALRSHLFGASNLELRGFERSMQTMFQTWYVSREQKLEREAQDSSVFKYSAPEELSIDDYRELFPDYEGDVSQVAERDQEQLLDEQIFTVQAAIATLMIDTAAPAELSTHLLKNTVDAILDMSIISEENIPGNGFLGRLLATTVYEAHRAGKRLQSNRIEQHVEAYDFYHDSNVFEQKKIIPVMLKLRARVSKIIDAWPENAVLREIDDGISRLLNSSITIPLAQTLTMLEQLLGLLNQWQEVASKEFSVADLFDQVRAQIIDWRRFELSCWPRLFDLEQASTKRADAGTWYNLYEVLVFAPSQEGADLSDEFLLTTVNLLMQFMRSSTLGQFKHRLQRLDAFVQFVKLLSDGFFADILVQAISHVHKYFSTFAQSIQDHLDQERKVLAKEVNQVIKLASWKDTNVFALRESAKRSHRTLYKIVHKFRRILSSPVLVVLSKGLPQVTNSSLLRKEQRIHAYASSEILADVPDVPLASSWPARYRNTKRTARKIEATIDMAGSKVVNLLATFVDDAIDTMNDLKSQTPSEFDKSKLPLIKHLKNRKRKLLSDSFKTLKTLGLKSAISPHDLEMQKSPEDVFLNVTTISNAITESKVIDHYFYRIGDILPQIRAGYANHVEDITAAEVKRGTGYFDSIFSHLLRQRHSLVSFIDSKSIYDKALTLFSSVTLAEGQDTDELDLTGDFHSLKSSCTARIKLVNAIEQMFDLTESYHEAHQEFARNDRRLAGESWWTQMRLDFKNGSSFLSKSQEYIYPPKSLRKDLVEHARIFNEMRDTVSHKQHENPATAYIFEALLEIISNAELDTEETIAPQGQLGAEQIDLKIRALCDSILTAIQRVNDSLSKRERISEDKWFAESSASQLSLLGSSNIKKVAQDFEKLVCELQNSSFSGQNRLLQELFTHFAVILQAYSKVCEALLSQYTAFHISTSRCTLLIGQTLNTLATNGFCSPAPADESTQTGTTTEGTGLGSGEGVEDITKDLEDDEDVGDLEGAEDTTGDHKEDENNDAKEVGEDMAGDLEDVNEDGRSESEGSDSEASELDEEIGEVEDQNDTALDEKMWDDEKDDLRDKTTDKQDAKDGQQQDNQDVDLVDQQGEEEETREAKPEDAPEPKGQEDDDKSDAREDEIEDRSKPEAEDEGENSPMEDAHNLELPDDLNIDGDSEDDNKDNVEPQDQSMDELNEEHVEEIDAEQETNPEHEEDDALHEDEQDSERPGDEADSVDENKDTQNDNITEDELSIGKEDAEMTPEDTAEEEEAGPEAGGKEANSRDSGIEHNKDIEHSDEMDIDQTEVTNDEEKTEGANGTGANGTRNKDSNTAPKDQDSEELRSLGDALEQFRRMLHIDDSQPQLEALDQQQEQSIAEADQVQHIDDEQQHDLQAMGPSAQDDAQGAAQDQEVEVPQLDDPRDDNEQMQEDTLENENQETQRQPADLNQRRTLADGVQDLKDKRQAQESEDDIMSVDDVDAIQITAPESSLTEVKSEAARLWQKHEQSTRDLANGLCEQLRLILEPTLATKLKGDFRTGKRLNMRRIIPYIASQFKKDKIWMRRARPSKRQYQVMLAIDDSKSMLESSSIQLAFDTVALVSTALSVLEVGQISVVKFGNQPETVHAFQDQFSSESGAKIFSAFSFDQTKTNVKALAGQSIEMFRDARANQHGNGGELWQLQFIISDGICEDHDGIKRLMRQAQEERIMVVFLVIDTLHGAKKDSILQMKQVKYITQPDGTKKLHIIPYMEEFAFENFLIIQEVSDLPELLCSTLRQFFAASQ